MTEGQQTARKRIAVVTGASSGIGAAIAAALASDGAQVALLARRADLLDRVAAQIAEEGGEALAIPTDITDSNELKAASEQVRKVFGPADLLVNSAGGLLIETAEEGDLDQWAKLIDLNVNGVLRTTDAFLPDLLLAGASGQSADLITISSISADVVNPLLTAYGMSKAAISHMSANLRAELGPKGVRVTAIEPAVVKTALLENSSHPMYRQYMQHLFASIEMLVPEDIARVVAFVVAQPRHVNLPNVKVYATQQP
ncbi:SDR family oxidoreductase [Sphaerisporangium sp. TRM90804]|uniref:SDR family oxidoreductase n=1 Tax=Sphaerisporangium sp. TRM90804 TaxID=3031113 RepID=UPI0024482196|nr:SDR family oxidoreductase [Sphaerisporangium sp. TRM90804]MDH2430510.1 SDR family oxidoreductase [Sphaerisporangium sp. TRM90804]